MSSCVSTTYHKEKLINCKSISKQLISLKLDGFYYSKIIQKFEKKEVLVLILYRDGFLINAGNYDALSESYCELSKSKYENTYENAILRCKKHFEYLSESDKVFESCKFKENDIDKKGLFQIKNDSIKIQYYQAEPQNENEDSFNSYFLYELNGIILSEEVFHITEKINYRKKTKEKIDFVFSFNKDKNLPIISNYFLNSNRFKNEDR